MSSTFHIIQYAPSPMAGERVNVGIIVTAGGQHRVHFVENMSRLKCFGGNDAVRAVKSFAKSLSRQISDELVDAAVKQWRGCIQVTKARGSLHDADFLLHDLADRFLFDPPQAKPGHLIKHDVQKAVRESLNRNLRSYLGGAGPLLLKSDYRGVSDGDLYTFDFAIANGTPKHFVQALSFQVEATKRIEKEVNAAAWSIQKVREANKSTPITVVAAEPVDGQKDAAEVFDYAVKTYRRLDTSLVPHVAVEEWARGISSTLAR